MKRSKWNTFDVIDRVGPCNSLMIVGEKRWQVAEALIVAIYVAADELKAADDTRIFVCDDGWGNCLVLREPVPELFVEALLNGIPGARVVPVDFGDSPTRLLMTLGRRGVEVHTDPVLPGYVGPAPDGNRWDSYGEDWGSEWSVSRYYAYRKQKAKRAAAAAAAPQPHQAGADDRPGGGSVRAGLS
jgi:hypothetical protein